MDVESIFQSVVFSTAILYLLLVGSLLFRPTLSIRLLGLYLMTFATVLLNSLFFQSQGVLVVAIVLTGPLLLLVSQAFFTENLQRRNLIASWLAILVIAAHFVSTSSWLFSSILVSYLLFYAYVIAKRISYETRTKGLAFFRNPGQRIAWFRNFILLQLLLSPLLLYYATTSAASISVPLIVLLIVNVILIYYQIFRESTFHNPIPSGQKYSKSSLTQDQKFSILNRLEKLMADEKLYVDTDISLTDLSQKLNTTTHNLSQVLNEQKGVSFAEYVMSYRVEEAKRIIRHDSNKSLKIEDIALQVGYNSKSAFNTAFKRLTRLTPSEFRQLKNVRDYREERLAGRVIQQYGTQQDSFDEYLKLFDMVRNFFLVFSRTLIRNRIFTAINLFGLVLGFTSSLFIYLFITDELSYDKDLPGADDIYRIAWLNESPQTRTPHPMAQSMRRDFPEVINAVSISPWYGAGLSKQKITVKNPQNDTQFEEPEFFFVDSTFLDVFQIDLISGNQQTALKQPGGILLSKTMSQKYFGDEDPLGRRLLISGDEFPIQVVGVFPDTPDNTHFHYNFLISYVTWKAARPENDFHMTWGDFGHFNYIKLQEGTDPATLEAKIPEWFLNYNDWSEQAIAGLLNGTDRFKLQRITDIHLHSNIRWELEANGNMLYIYILTGAVIFILTIASINYINLTTAKSVERAKEIGIRKTLGALKGHLSLQFLTESILFCLIAGLFALILTAGLLPNFNDLSGKSFEILDILDVKLLLLGFFGILLIGFISGLYPSLSLSSFKPTEIMKGTFSRSNRGNMLSRVLVISQFIISAILISASLIILKQTNYLKEKPLGFEQDYVVTVPLKSNDMRGRHQVVTNELRQLNGVINATAVSNIPGGQFNQNAIWTDFDPQNPVTVSEISFDYQTIKTLGLKLAVGRNFEQSYAMDSAGASFLINQAAVKQLRLDEPIGTKIIWDLEAGHREGHVVGVLEDFHYKSLHQGIQPLIVDMRRSSPGHLLIRVDNNNIATTLEAIGATYKKFDAKHDFEYTFLDQTIDDLYSAEVRTLNIFGLFSLIALVLACLGLLGIAISMMNQKIKEVGIRKIHGASAGQILWMINWRFSKLVVLALAIGLPLAYLLMTDWIAEFPYQINLGIMPFLTAVMVLVGVALITTTAVVMKVAVTNPAEALRHE